METKQKLSLKSKISYGLGAVGKDMVYMLSASYVLYYFQDLLGVNAIAMGVILMIIIALLSAVQFKFAQTK